MTGEEFKQALETRIEAWFESEKTKAPTLEARELVHRMHTLVQRGGKRSRPELLFLTYRAYGGKNPESIIDLGVALEIYHQFLLVHDDIMDGDVVRYGGPNVVGMYQSEGVTDVAESMGILAGDLLFTYANRLILESASLSGDIKMELLQSLHAVNADELFGQQLDILNTVEHIDDFSEELITRIHELKTARYTTQLPMIAAAIVLGLSHEERQKLETFGRQFGIAYQLADDYADYFENPSSFSAQKYRDYRSGKVTYPIYLGLARATPADRELLRQDFGNKHCSDAVITDVLSVLDACGAREHSRQRALEYLDEALVSLETLHASDEAKMALRHLLEKIRV